MDGLTLDQFAVFVAVVDAGSFSAAARQLNRAQSAVTYAVQKLEEQSGGIALFDRSAYRPTLTAAGRALLPTARALLQTVARYRGQAADILRGLESEVRIVVDMLTPLDCLFPALRAFAQEFPGVSVRLATEFHDSAAQALLEGRADLAILPEMRARMLGLDHDRLTRIAFIAVAAPSHPLAKLPGSLSAATLEAHMQIVVESRVNILGSKDFGVVGTRRWYLSDLQTKLSLLNAGIGWGTLPHHLVAPMLADGRLIALEPGRWEGGDHMPEMALAIAHRPEAPPGPAGRWLVERLRAEGDRTQTQAAMA